MLLYVFYQRRRAIKVKQGFIFARPMWHNMATLGQFADPIH